MNEEKAELTSSISLTPIGISREAVRQQQQRILRKARKLLRDKGLKASDFFETTRRPNKC
jgi:hypothetical protein